jgi:hypothetical protein
MSWGAVRLGRTPSRPRTVLYQGEAMDDRDFDAFTKAVTRNQANRRTALHAVASAIVGALAVRFPDSAGAKKRKKKRKKKCKGGTKKCAKRCLDLSIDGDNCGAYGQACISGECERGVCRCEGQTECPLNCYCVERQQGGGACIAAAFLGAECATDADCPIRSICFNNRCSQPCVG